MLNLKNITYEVIFVIEENNEDDTYEVINEYMVDMNYKIIYSNGGTVGIARNIGLEAARGDYIWFVDGDDWIINPEILQMALGELRKSNLSIIQIKFVSNYFNMEHYSMVWQYIFKKDFLNNVSFNKEKHYEDNDFMTKVFQKLGYGYRITLITIPSYFYNYERPGSLMYNLRRGIK